MKKTFREILERAIADFEECVDSDERSDVVQQMLEDLAKNSIIARLIS